jgi:tRNA(His) guanylyltransferase
MNPITQEIFIATRRRIKVDMELSLKDNYSVFIKDLVMREHPDEKQQNF